MELSIGDRVTLKTPMPYLKTTDSLSMLRPPDLVALDEIGEVVAIRNFDLAEVKFRRGTFLIPFERLSF